MPCRSSATWLLCRLECRLNWPDAIVCAMRSSQQGSPFRKTRCHSREGGNPGPRNSSFAVAPRFGGGDNLLWRLSSARGRGWQIAPALAVIDGLALLQLGLDRVDDLLHGDLRIGFLALQVGFPDRLADHELLQAEEVVGDGLRLVQLAADQPDELRQPVRLVRSPVGVARLVARQLARIEARGADDRVLPDLLVVGQRLYVLGRLLLVLAVLEERAAGRPEHRRALAVLELRQRAQMQLLRIVPARRHAQRRVEVFE